MNLRQRYKQNFGKGWFFDSWRHSLASKGIKTKYMAFKPKGVYSPALQPIRRPLSRKGQLLKEIDYWEDLLDSLRAGKDVGTDETEIQTKIANLQYQLHHITGAPPYKEARGETLPELQEGVIEHYEGTSTRRPQFVIELEAQKIPMMVKTQVKPLVSLASAQRYKAEAAYKASIPRVVKIAEQEAIKGEEPRPLKLSDISRKRKKKKDEFIEDIPDLNMAMKR